MSLPGSAIKDPATKRLNGLDHLRALAIILVFIFHYRMFEHPQWINNVGNFGWTGVDLFFVLSGYLIGGQLLSKVAKGQNISFSEFYFKRFFRIIPAYLAVLALYFIIPGFREKDTIAPLWKFLSFTQNLGLDIRYHRSFSHAWSLCIEEQFYLLLPLILMAFIACKAINKAAYLILGLFIFGFAVRIFCWMQLVSPLSGSDEFRFAWYKWIYYPTYSRLDGLLAGVGIAALFQFKPKIKYRITGYGNTLLIISGLILVAASFLSSGEPSFNASVFGFPFVSILYGVLVLAALSPSGILYKFHSSITKNIATLSYSIYLTHKALIHLTQELVPKYGINADSNTSFVLCILVSLLGGWILHQVVERPFMKLRDKMLKKEQVSSNSLVNPVPLQAVKNSDDKQV